MIILGIDPGIAIVGYCALNLDEDGNCKIISWGCIQTVKEKTTSARLLEIYNDLKVLISELKPDVVAIEKIFFFKNAKTLVPVLEARGVVLLTVEMFDLPVYEYTPLVVKQVLTGYGRATKNEVKDMLSRELDLTTVPKLDDVVDAAAIAYCHTRHL